MMNEKKFDIVNSDKFVAQYMKGDDNSFIAQQSPIQIYPLESTANLVKAPTPLFRAEYNFLLLFSKGGGKQQIDNEILHLLKNDVLFIREGHLNAIKSTFSDSAGYFVYMDSTLLPQIFSDRNILNHFTFYPKRSVSEKVMQWLCNCCHLIYEQIRENQKSLELQTSLLKALVLKLSESSSEAITKPDRQTEVTMLFKELLYEHFKEKREINFYADALAVSENYLNRCVKNITNKAPKQHITEVVIFHSQALLQDLSRDISQIAFDLNFSDPAYFGRVFKQLTNQTPTEYRNSFMQDFS